MIFQNKLHFSLNFGLNISIYGIILKATNAKSSKREPVRKFTWSAEVAITRSLRLGIHLQVLPTLSILALGPDTGCCLWFCFLIIKMKALGAPGWLSRLSVRLWLRS